MDSESIPYEKVILVCVNDAKGEKPSCGDHRGEEIFRRLRELAKERGLHPRIRVTQAKCLGQCAKGCNIMVYPDNVWYSGVSVNDVENMAKILFSAA